MGNKFLILGAGGQLGSEWVKRLTYLDKDFLATDYPKTDITNRVQMEERITGFKPDYVINCAAYTQVDKAEDEPELASLVNAEAVGQLAKICKQNKAVLIHYSTDYVFSGNTEDGYKFPNGYPEDAPIAPVNAYGLSKWKGEEAIREIFENHIIMRISWLCGPVGHNFMKTMLRLAGEHDEIRVVDDQTGSPTFAYDVVDACMKLIDNRFAGTIHVTSQGVISWLEFARKIIVAAGLSTNVVAITSDEFPTKARRPFYSKLCTKKFEGITGGVTYDTDAGINRILSEL